MTRPLSHELRPYRRLLSALVYRAVLDTQCGGRNRGHEDRLLRMHRRSALEFLQSPEAEAIAGWLDIPTERYRYLVRRVKHRRDCGIPGYFTSSREGQAE